MSINLQCVSSGGPDVETSKAENERELHIQKIEVEIKPKV